MTAKLLLASVLILGLASPAGHARAPRAACWAPIRYRIGTLDPRFGITRADFKRDVEEASQVWEAGAERTLFSYDDKGPLQIDLVYDGRQQATQRFVVIRAGISEKLKEADSIEDRLRPLRNQAGALDKAYSDQLSSHKQLQDEYNATVARWNKQGGVPESEYQRLRGQGLMLHDQAALLEAKRQELNGLTRDINALVSQHNALVGHANAEANALSTSGLADVEFEEGHYIKQAGEQRIEIFQYESEAGLRIILSHELGHALGIRHNANPSSIMSPLIHTDRLALTEEDMNDLKAACFVNGGEKSLNTPEKRPAAP